MAIINRKQVVAPFSGELGIRMFDLGQFVAPSELVVSLQQNCPIYVDFDLPEQNAGVVKSGLTIRVAVAGYPIGRVCWRIAKQEGLIRRDAMEKAAP